jgi:hypothetical protein
MLAQHLHRDPRGAVQADVQEAVDIRAFAVGRLLEHRPTGEPVFASDHQLCDRQCHGLVETRRHGSEPP